MVAVVDGQHQQHRGVLSCPGLDHPKWNSSLLFLAQALSIMSSAAYLDSPLRFSSAGSRSFLSNRRTSLFHSSFPRFFLSAPFRFPFICPVFFPFPVRPPLFFWFLILHPLSFSRHSSFPLFFSSSPTSLFSEAEAPLSATSFLSPLFLLSPSPGSSVLISPLTLFFSFFLFLFCSLKPFSSHFLA